MKDPQSASAGSRHLATKTDRAEIEDLLRESEEQVRRFLERFDAGLPLTREVLGKPVKKPRRET